MASTLLVEQPTMIVRDNSIYWILNGEYHKDGSHAVEHPNGDRYWYQHGQLHRENGPAIEHQSGDKEWYKHGLLHREPSDVDPLGGPAVEFSISGKQWFYNDLCHREDGPAIIDIDGTESWYLNGFKVTEEEHSLQTNMVKASQRCLVAEDMCPITIQTIPAGHCNDTARHIRRH